MMNIIPISKTEVDWNSLLYGFQQILGKTYDYKETKSLYLDILQNTFKSSMLEHIHYSFFIISSKEFFFRLMQYQNIINLNIIESVKLEYYLAIITGNLKEYVDFIKASSTGEEHIEIRLLANQLQQYFEDEGFRYIFYQYIKIPMIHPDTTYKLTER